MTENLKDGVSGKPAGGRAGSIRSSRIPSAIFNKLRNLDKQISLLDNKIKYCFLENEFRKKLQNKRARLDQKRKETRQKIKNDKKRNLGN